MLKILKKIVYRLRTPLDVADCGIIVTLVVGCVFLADGLWQYFRLRG